MASSPSVEAFVGKHGARWRLYVAGWLPPYVRQKLDASGEALLASAPDFGALDAFMFGLDAPYEKQVATNGDAAILARGRSAVVLAEWLDARLT